MTKEQQRSIPKFDEDFLKKILEKESTVLSKNSFWMSEYLVITNNYDTFYV